MERRQKLQIRMILLYGRDLLPIQLRGSWQIQIDSII